MVDTSQQEQALPCGPGPWHKRQDDGWVSRVALQGDSLESIQALRYHVHRGAWETSIWSGLNENGPHSLTYMNAWSLVGGLFGKD